MMMWLALTMLIFFTAWRVEYNGAPWWMTAFFISAGAGVGLAFFRWRLRR